VPAPRRLVALVDCSAFYVSCERVFDPSSEGEDEGEERFTMVLTRVPE
jgi:hypothetical protein